MVPVAFRAVTLAVVPVSPAIRRLEPVAQGRCVAHLVARPPKGARSMRCKLTSASAAKAPI